LTFYPLDEELPPTDQQRSLIESAYSTSTKANSVVCLLVTPEGKGIIVEVNPDSQIKNVKVVNENVVGAHFGSEEL
jgi:hypothetical protein